MAVLNIGFFDCGINTLCEKRGASLHRVSRHRSGKAYSSRYSENEMRGKKGARKADDFSYRKSASAWWLPLFGWSPDHKWAEEKNEEEEKGGSSVESVQKVQHSIDKKSEEDQIRSKRRSKSVPVRFTAEKAKILRKTVRSTSTFHDLMYHSAIASRLASPDTSSTEEESKNGKA